ncbi:MAG: PAS domain S-box protein, partial [Acaryochloridaceae cyanobacterium RL_2_7]|nr:PAS domain S-box protein [Acaryochloridaceae cyanobacterium RL_2_7]
MQLSEVKANAVFEQAAVGFLEVDLMTQKFVRVNPYFCELSGYSESELRTMTIADITYHKDHKKSFDALNHLYRGTIEKFSLEKRYVRKNGTIFWAETTSYLITLKDGQTPYSVGIIKDITDKKRLEYQRQKQEKELKISQFALANASTSIFWINHEGYFIKTNEAACMQLGYTPDEVKKLGVWDITPSFPKEAWSAHWQDIQVQSYQRFETHHQTQQGIQFPVEITSNYFEYEGTGFLFAQVQDISARKAIEKQLNLIKFTFEHLTDQIMTISLEGQIIDANPAACHSLGYTYQELCRLTLFDICPEATHNWSKVISSIQGGQSLSLETYHQCKNGELFPIEVVINAFRFDNQEYVVGIARDITARKNAAQEINQQKTHLEALLNNIPYMAWIKDSESRFIAVNEPFAQAAGVPVEKIIGGTDLD